MSADDASEGELSSFVASLTSPEGRTVDVRTTEPTLVVYTGKERERRGGEQWCCLTNALTPVTHTHAHVFAGNFLDGSIEGKNGRPILSFLHQHFFI